MTDAAVTPALEQRGIDVIRALSMDAVQQAKSGHPGTPMALAPLAHVLYTRVMTYDATDPQWPDRDRFILSAGHASMLLYSLLYLTGFGLELSDIEQFRQLGSRTPGHPEVHHTPGVEVTTGPLGQGFANGVGMAITEANLRARFGADLTDHHIFSICGDGDLMEGVSHEAASLAGHLRLGRLVYVYDDNHITIDGGTELAFSENIPQRFESYGWQVIQLGEAANDLDEMERGLREAMAETDRPSLVVVRSHIGYPSPKFTDTSKAHGAPLGEDEIRVVKKLLGMDPDAKFAVPDDVLAMYRAAGARGASARAEWTERLATARANDTDRVEEYELALAGQGRAGWAQKLPTWSEGESVATRAASVKVLDSVVDLVPGLIGGGADLTDNTGTKVAREIADSLHPGGRQLHFGVREHGMGSAMVGMALHGGSMPFGGTFLVFADYMRPAVRMAALSDAKVAFVWSHDSLGVGEDGPTHQPVEQVASLRAIPNLRVLRPADANETAAAWRLHIEADAGPSALILTRQNLPVLAGTADGAWDGIRAGAYVLEREAAATPQIVIVGTGSETQLAVAAAKQLQHDSIAARAVSMPWREGFLAQDAATRDAVIPAGVPVLAVEAGVREGWDAVADDVIAIGRFGASGPGQQVLDAYGFTVDNVVARAHALHATGS
ncbi:MAG: transketolase [Acidimicrobiia bacterium]